MFQKIYNKCRDKKIIVYLPDDYYQSEERYPVLYMNDGQNAFFDDQAYIGVSWGMEPESVLPYHRFLKSFQIPEVHSAMSMLFSVSMGNSGRADRQIGELIDRNLEMLDVAEKGRLKNLSSGMYLLFLAPVLTASLKLLVDMAVFMMTFLSGAGLG